MTYNRSAFPVPSNVSNIGMSLREYIAAQVLASLVPLYGRGLAGEEPAMLAVAAAEALIRELNGERSSHD